MERPDYFEWLYRIVDGLNARFPGGDESFRIVTRLCEEAGELASAVNHFEGAGVKRSKHGSPDPEMLAKEIQDVLRAALALARHYGVEDRLYASIDESYHTLLAEGYITNPSE